MTILCKKFFPNELAVLQNSLIRPDLRSNRSLRRAVTASDDMEAEVEEEEEEDETQRDESDEEEEDVGASNLNVLDIDDEWDDGVTVVESERRRQSVAKGKVAWGVVVQELGPQDTTSR